MRAVGVLAILMVGVLIYAVMSLRVPDRAVRVFRALTGEPVKPAAPESSSSASPSKDPRKARARKPVQAKAAAAPAEPLEVPVLEVMVRLPAFPTSENVRLGTARTNLVSQFGEPDLKATTAISKRLVERYVYSIAKDRTTMVMLSDAKVIGVSTDPVR